jgi:hypothetical protein
MFRSIVLSVLAIGLPISPTLAKTVSVDRQQITANISNDLGQLFDWSPTDRRIERIFFDNPEQFHKSFIFTTDGCKKDKCTNASLLNISARPGSGDARSSIKVVLANRLGKKYIYTIRLIKVRAVEDGVITFLPSTPPQVNVARRSVIFPVDPSKPIYINR